MKLRAARLGGTDQVEILAETELDAVCATLETRTARRLCDRLDPDALRLGHELRAGLGRPGPGGGRTPSPRRQGVRRRHDPRRARDEGRSCRGPAGARAPRRLRAPVRGRPVPRPPRAARDEEPLRIDQRARRLRDDRRGPRRRARSLRAVRQDASGRDRRRRSPARSRGRVRSCSRSSRSSRPPISRCRAASARGSTPSVWR